MKKIFLIAGALIVCALASYAQQANIYASGLKVEKVDATHYKFSYTLNADAKGISIKIFNADNSYYATNSLQLDEYKTKGAHSYTLNLDDLSKGDYFWSVYAFSDNITAPALVSNDNLQFLFYGPRGVAVDNSFDSPYFGTAYISEGAGGKVAANLGAEDPTRTTSKGIYALSPAFENLTPEGPYTGGQDWSASNSPYRLTVAPDGKVYLADYSASAHSGVYIMNPANTAAFTPVFGEAADATGLATTGGGATIHGRIGHCYVLGTGANTQLFTYDWGGAATTGDIYRYDIGELNTPWTAEPSAIVYNDAQNGNLIQGGNCSIAPDNRGGWWICQYRYDNTAAIPSLIHITAKGTVTNFGGTPYNVDIPGSYQAGMAVSLDGNLLAMGTSQAGMGRITIFDLTYAADTYLPSFTKKYDIETVNGAYVIGAALDMAGNLYTVDNNKERLRIHALPKAENEFTTPAPASQKITIGGTDIVSPKLDNSIRLVNENGQIRLLADGLQVKTYLLYNVAGSALLSGNAAAGEVVIPTGSLSAGVYILQVVTNEGTVVKRFIKK